MDVASTVLEARGLRKRFGSTEVLRGVDLSLQRAELVLLMGPNAAGKTSLINILTGHLEADAGEITIRTNGTIERFSFPFGIRKRLNPFLHFLPERVARKGVMRTWQDTRLFPSLGLAENIAVSAPAHPGQNPLNLFLRPGAVKRFEQDATSEARHRLRLLQLDGRDASFGDRISLGQTKRVAIAQAITAQARILFFDEPLAGLDAEGITSVVDMLLELVRDHGTSIVVVEHHMNAPHILQIADTVWNLDRGIVTARSARDTNAEPESEKADVFAGHLERNAWHIARESLLPKGARLRVYRRTPFTVGAKPILAVRGLAVKRGNRWVIGRVDETDQITDTLDLELYPGDIGLLLAPNGWGKTSALDSIAGLISVHAGDVEFFYRLITGWTPWRIARMGMRYVRSASSPFQDLNISEYAKLSTAGKKHWPKIESLRIMGELSSGESHFITQSVRFSTPYNPLMLLDEPFSGLDTEHFLEMANNYLSYINNDIAGGINAALFALPDRSYATKNCFCVDESTQKAATFNNGLRI